MIAVRDFTRLACGGWKEKAFWRDFLGCILCESVSPCQTLSAAGSLTQPLCCIMFHDRSQASLCSPYRFFRWEMGSKARLTVHSVKYQVINFRCIAHPLIRETERGRTFHVTISFQNHHRSHGATADNRSLLIGNLVGCPSIHPSSQPSSSLF